MVFYYVEFLERGGIKINNYKFLDMFLSSKDIEGCSSRTIKYYRDIISKFIEYTNKLFSEVTTDDIRLYLSHYKETSKCGTVTMDNIRRVFSSFFAWLEDEDYILDILRN